MRGWVWRFWGGLTVFLLAVCLGAGTAWGTQESLAPEEGARILGIEEELEEIQAYLEEQMEGGSFSFLSLMKELLKGDFQGALEMAGQGLKQNLAQEIGQGGRLMAQVAAVGLLGAVFTNFSSIFKSKQISDTGFFVSYLLLFTLLSASFMSSCSIAQKALDQVLGFMKVLMPAYFLAAAFSGGSASAAVLYEVMLAGIGAVQWVSRNLLLPGVKIYVVLVMASHAAKEEMLTRMADFLEQGIGWCLKTMVGVILGLHMVQGMVLPFADSAVQAGARKVIGLIPGIGRGAEAAAQMILGSGTLIKNTMGAAAVVILGLLTLIPLVKLVVLMVLCQGAAAVMQPVCDPRAVACLEGISAAHRLLIRIVLYALILFGVAIALTCWATNVNYYSL